MARLAGRENRGRRIAIVALCVLIPLGLLFVAAGMTREDPGEGEGRPPSPTAEELVRDAVVQQIPEGTGRSSVAIVDSPVLPRQKAYRFTVRPGGVRAELAAWHELMREGDEWWFGDVLYVPSRPNKALGWSAGHHTLMQWKDAGTGSPPLQLDLTGRWAQAGFQLFAIGSSDRLASVVVPGGRIYDRPIPIEARVRFSADRSKGEYEIWADGRRIVPTVSAATLNAGEPSYLKQGLYGDSAGNVVYWHGARRGPSRASVRRI